MSISEQVGCQVSELVDGELGAAEREFLIRRLVKDQELQKRWGDYHTIGEALKNQLPDRIDPGFALRVSQAIEQEPVHSQAQVTARNGANSSLKKIAGWAVAASVAVLGVTGVMTIVQQEGSISGAPMAMQESVNKPVVVAQSNNQTNAPVPALASATSSAKPLKDPRLNKYLVNHSEYAVGASVHGVLPYARIVGQPVKK